MIRSPASTPDSTEHIWIDTIPGVNDEAMCLASSNPRALCQRQPTILGCLRGRPNPDRVTQDEWTDILQLVDTP